MCCGSWGRKESDTTELLNRTELNAGCNLISIFNLLTILLILSSIYKEYKNVDILIKSVEIVSKRFQQRHIIRTWFLKINYFISKVLFSKVKPVGCRTLSSKTSNLPRSHLEVYGPLPHCTEQGQQEAFSHSSPEQTPQLCQIK